MTKLCYYAILLFGIANFFGLIATIAVFLAPHPETDALFHDDVYNGLEINLQDLGYVGGLLRVIHTRNLHESELSRIMTS